MNEINFDDVWDFLQTTDAGDDMYFITDEDRENMKFIRSQIPACRDLNDQEIIKALIKYVSRQSL